MLINVNDMLTNYITNYVNQTNQACRSVPSIKSRLQLYRTSARARGEIISYYQSVFTQNWVSVRK